MQQDEEIFHGKFVRRHRGEKKEEERGERERRESHSGKGLVRPENGLQPGFDVLFSATRLSSFFLYRMASSLLIVMCLYREG